MNPEKMIMGEPPDLAGKPKKRFLIFLVFVALLLAVGTVFLLTLEKNGEPPIAFEASSKTTSVQPEEGNKAKYADQIEVRKPSNAQDLPKSEPAVQKPLENPIPTSVTDIQDKLARGNETGPSQTEPIATQTEETKTIVSLESETGQKISEREAESRMKQVQNTEVHKGEIFPTPKTSFSFPATLHFMFKSTDLPPSAVVIIKNALRRIADKEGRLILEGHTCSIGSCKSNMDFSEKRVKNVAKAFRELGLGMNVRMSLLSYGESRPASTNETTEGRVQNRRVSIRFIPSN